VAIIIDTHTDNNCHLGIWKITEDYDDLMSRLHLSSDEEKTLERFSHMPRKLEWLSVRALLKEMTGKRLSILYNGNRKPYLKRNLYYISISHSRDLTSILLSRKHHVGIDLEYMSHRITSLANKFINVSEYITDDSELVKYHLYIHWCAKEALYKICDKQDINFKDSLTIEPFIPQERGTIKGWVKNSLRNESFDMNYFNLGNYVIVWCSK